MYNDIRNSDRCQGIAKHYRTQSIQQLEKITESDHTCIEIHRSRSNRNIRAITINEIKRATTMWIQHAKRSSFREEIQYMNQTSNDKKPWIIRQV